MARRLFAHLRQAGLLHDERRKYLTPCQSALLAGTQQSRPPTMIKATAGCPGPHYNVGCR